jgi:tmRNA-binding protein
MKFFLEFDAGIVLVGNEVKSIREGNVTISDHIFILKMVKIWIKESKSSKI